MTKLRLVPLPDFFVVPRDAQKKPSTLVKNFLTCRLINLFLLPCRNTTKYSQYSPFLRVLIRDKGTTIFSNPSLSALIDYKWRQAQLFFLRHFLIYILFALIFASTNSAIYVERLRPHHSREVNILLQAIFYYLGYYQLAVAFVRFNHHGFKRSVTIYKFFNYASIIMPVSLIFYLNLNHSHIDQQVLRSYTSITSTTTLIMWIEFVSTKASIKIDLDLKKKSKSLLSLF
jgi:hypothetical protein